MNFSMTYPNVFSIKDRIECLERSILVNSYAYYELNDNILPDYKYDANTVQLENFAKQFPAEFIKSRYYKYFYDFCAVEDGEVCHNSSGFDLLSRVKNDDKDLYGRIRIDAVWALDSKANPPPGLKKQSDNL